MELTITTENFEELRNGTLPLVVDLWATWCGPCKAIAPIIAELAQEYEGKIAVGKCDVEENDDIAMEFGVRNIPTILFFKGGKLAKGTLLGAPGIGAAIDDGLLNIPFKVQRFETVFFDRMGNARPETSNGAAFSDNQRSLMRETRRGSRFYITNVHVIGPDGIARTLPQALEVIVN